MKILVHANAPYVRTGYGVQCAQLVERLKADGHDPAVSSTYGQQGAVGTWRGTTVYPCGYDQNGNDVLHNHAKHHFAGENGWIIPLIDVWCLVNPLLADFNIAAWTPVDHFPIPPEVLQFFNRTKAVPLAMSRYGEKLLAAAGLDPVYVPLAVDTKTLKPTLSLTIGDREVSGRELLEVPDDAFLVGMVAMNKDPRDRKGFNEAFRAFGVFWRQHPNAVLYVHSDWPGGAGGPNLKQLATHAGIPPHAIRFPDLYAYFPHGFTPEQMALMYSTFDVLLAPSHGEGFCVPLIEAQACGTPVIATDFSAQRELVLGDERGGPAGAGWLVEGQPEWDAAQTASYICPSIVDVVEKLEAAWEARQDPMAWARLSHQATTFAARYDADTVYDTHWRPFLASLDESTDPVPLDREPMPETDAVAVVVPVMRRPQNVAPLVESLNRCEPGATVYFVCDPDDLAEIEAVQAAGANVIISQRGHTYAAKANVALDCTDEPWIFLCGDDVRFHPGWLDEARKLSDRFDVIGTNDTTGPVKNPDVASGRHSDHCFFRRAYVDTYGASLDGPGTIASEEYEHWFVDKEQVGLAKARNVFTPCLSSVVEHLHPGYDGKPRDEVYMKAMEASERDAKRWEARRPLVEMQRTGRSKIR